MRYPSYEKKLKLILDTSTIITLSELGSIRLLEELSRSSGVDVIIPPEVLVEITRSRSVIPLTQNFFRVLQADTKSLPNDVPRRLGTGERALIAIAHELTKRSQETVIAVTDDKSARSKCEKIKVRVCGTLGLIELAKKLGIISKKDALELIQRIPETSLRVNYDILTRVKSSIERQREVNRELT